jgi:hypothetical protein
LTLKSVIVKASSMKKRPQLLNGQECAIALLRLIEIRNEEAPPVSRIRLSELTLRRLWGRDRLTRELLEEVQEWLSRAGWVIFFAGRTYAAIRTSVVLSWSRLSSKRMAEELKSIRAGDFDFDGQIHLIENDLESSDGE